MSAMHRETNCPSNELVQLGVGQVLVLVFFKLIDFGFNFLQTVWLTYSGLALYYILVHKIYLIDAIKL